jgi:tetratricopeptide (TPR) repeat protein
LNNLGVLARDRGNFHDAANCYGEALGVFRAMSNEHGEAITLTNLAEVLRYTGEHTQANIMYREGLAMHQRAGNKLGVISSLEGLAALARLQGQPERAAHLWGASEALRAQLGAALQPTDREDYDRNVAALRGDLAHDALAAAWAAGRDMTAEQAIAHATEPPA